MNRSCSIVLGLSLFLTSALSATSSAVIIRSAQHYEKLLGSKTPVVTLFSASWCGPCKIMKPRVMQAAVKFPDITFCIIDVDAKPLQKLCANIKTIPKLTFRQNGTTVSEHLGILSSAELATKCSELSPKTKSHRKK